MLNLNIVSDADQDYKKQLGVKKSQKILTREQKREKLTMAKFKAKKGTEQKKFRDPPFQNIQAGDWSIIENKITNRKELRHNDNIIMSDINSNYCKRFAELHHNVPSHVWTKI